MVQKSKIIIFVLVIIVAIIGIYYIGSGKIYKKTKEDIVFKDSLPTCDLHSSICKIEFDDQKRIGLNILNKPLSSNKELIYQVMTEGFDDNNLYISIVGVEMNMGLHEKKLIKNNDVYEATISLPACKSGHMIWEVSVISNKEKIGARYILGVK